MGGIGHLMIKHIDQDVQLEWFLLMETREDILEKCGTEIAGQVGNA